MVARSTDGQQGSRPLSTCRYRSEPGSGIHPRTLASRRHDPVRGEALIDFVPAETEPASGPSPANRSSTSPSGWRARAPVGYFGKLSTDFSAMSCCRRCRRMEWTRLWRCARPARPPWPSSTSRQAVAASLATSSTRTAPSTDPAIDELRSTLRPAFMRFTSAPSPSCWSPAHPAWRRCCSGVAPARDLARPNVRPR